MKHWGGPQGSPEEPTNVPLNKELTWQHLSHQRPLTGHLRLGYFTIIFYPSHSDPREARQAEKGGKGKGEDKSLSTVDPGPCLSKRKEKVLNGKEVFVLTGWYQLLSKHKTI